jgi:hypothetical protein
MYTSRAPIAAASAGQAVSEMNRPRRDSTVIDANVRPRYSSVTFSCRST